MKIHIRVSLLILLTSSLIYSQDLSDNALSAMARFRKPPEIIQGPVVVGTGANWAVIEWTTNPAGKSSSIVYAGTDKSYLRRIPQTRELVRISEVPSYQEQQYTHLVRLNQLEPGRTYYFRVDSGPGYDTATSKISQLTTTKRPG